MRSWNATRKGLYHLSLFFFWRFGVAIILYHSLRFSRYIYIIIIIITSTYIHKINESNTSANHRSRGDRTALSHGSSRFHEERSALSPSPFSFSLLRAKDALRSGTLLRDLPLVKNALGPSGGSLVWVCVCGEDARMGASLGTICCGSQEVPPTLY